MQDCSDNAAAIAASSVTLKVGNHVVCEARTTIVSQTASAAQEPRKNNAEHWKRGLLDLTKLEGGIGTASANCTTFVMNSAGTIPEVELIVRAAGAASYPDR